MSKANKPKPHRGSKDRFRVTKTGKVVARRSYRNHNLSKKTASRRRSFGQLNSFEGKLKKNIKSRL